MRYPRVVFCLLGILGAGLCWLGHFDCSARQAAGAPTPTSAETAAKDPSPVDVLLTPAVSGEAPEGLDHTGDSTFQSLWTLLHVPTVTLPTALTITVFGMSVQNI